MKRNYLAGFHLPNPQPEHAKITEAIRAVAQDVKVIPLGGKTILVLFTSEKLPHTIDFSRILLNGDQGFFIELGEYVATKDFQVMQGWLNSHRPAQ